MPNGITTNQMSGLMHSIERFFHAGKDDQDIFNEYNGEYSVEDIRKVRLMMGLRKKSQDQAGRWKVQRMKDSETYRLGYVRVPEEFVQKSGMRADRGYYVELLNHDPRAKTITLQVTEG